MRKDLVWRGSASLSLTQGSFHSWTRVNSQRIGSQTETRVSHHLKIHKELKIFKSCDFCF